MLREAAEKKLQEAATVVEQIDAQSVDVDSLNDWIVIDVREDQEYAEGHLPGAISLPRSRLEMMAMQSEALEAAVRKPALVYCGSGKRSLLAAQTLKELGVQRPVSMAGGIKAWREAGKPETRD